MKNDSDSMKKYQENAESWASYSRMRARRLRSDAELTEGATNGCEDKKEFSDEIPSSIRSANVGHFAQLLLKEVGWYFIFRHTLKQPFDLHPRYGGVGFFSHNNLSNHSPIQPLYYH